MKDLIDLVHVVTKPKLRSVELLNDASGGTSKLKEFYENIAKGQFNLDEEAATALYQVDKQAPVYQKLRKSLKDRLVNSLFVIDLKQPSYNDRQKAYYECYKEWAAAKILFGKNARNAAVGLALKLVKIVRKYEFTELLVDICHTLRLYYGTTERDPIKFAQYNQDFKQAEDLWRKENEVEELYIESNIASIHHKGSKEELKAKAEACFEMLKPILEQYNSYQIQLCGRLIEANIYSVVNDYQGLMDVASRAIAFFEQKDYEALIPLQVFLHQKAICHMQLGEYPEAQKAIEDELAHLEEGQFNWFKSQELYFFLLVQQNKYADARDLLYRGMKKFEFNQLPLNVIETWKIFQAYLYFLECMQQLPQLASTDQDKWSAFKPARFFNELSASTGDKQGMNIHVLMLEILLGLAHHEPCKLIDRIDAIDRYRMRYLQEDQLKRCNLFLKMLLKVPRFFHHKNDLLEKTKVDHQRLMTLTKKATNQALELEIVPYEVIWDLIIQSIPEEK